MKVLASFGTANLFLVCTVVAFSSLGARVGTTAAGLSECELPQVVGGPGVEVFGDAALAGLASKLPVTVAGGKVVEDVRRGRTAQQGVNALGDLPDTAPATFVVSLAADDASTERAYRERIDELMLTLAGRTVLWVTAPNTPVYTLIVNEENLIEASGQGGWQVLDFGASVRRHRDWWRAGRPTDAGLAYLAETIVATLDRAAADESSGAATDITVTSTSNSTNTFVLTGERLRNAQTIVSVGVRLGVPQRGLVISLATAIQESKLINLPGHPGAVYGLFQQTPPAWGTPTQVMNPTHAATAFYTHLLHVPGWQDMALTDTAEAVQHSGLPDAYAQWEQSATVIAAALTGQHAPGCGPQVAVPGNPRAQIAVNAALSQLGVPYSFGGGNANGPTLGFCMAGTAGWNDCHIVGFDCSGLMLYAWGKAGVSVPHFTGAMWTSPTFVHVYDVSALQRGDMMMFEPSPLGGTPGHTGMWLGDGKLIDAPHSGAVVTIESFTGWYRSEYLGALRPMV